MVKLWKHIFWGLIFPVVSVMLVIIVARLGIIFLPKWFGVEPVIMGFVGIVLIATIMLGSIYKYCDLVNGMEI